MEKIKDNLPRGAYKEIANNAKVSYSTVLNFVKGKDVTLEVQIKLIPAINKYFKLLEATEKAKQKLINYGK